jgi:uncharacterized protein YxjI
VIPPSPPGTAPAIDVERRLVLQQRYAPLEIATGIEQPNRYDLFTETGARVGQAAEISVGAEGFLTRWFFGSRRPFRMEIALGDATAPREVVRAERPWKWFLDRIDIAGGDGRPIGSVRQRLSFLRRRFDLLSPGGALRARIVGPVFHPWTFIVETGPAGAGREVGRIEKRWGGLATEAFTDADTFALSLPQGDPALRRLVLAAAILVDFAYFENRGR